ncbi:hypothetical protein NP493_1355g00006 [Ridgeia piscesae]|uniref:Uncharacterized protein n=1 Tax=Ridgeia piscesae TaxID=27915 RepID=A0AAD9K6A4_RIDPI|nr:hypothetical protein NP493_1355g00006 [Ridgeia piscesae]
MERLGLWGDGAAFKSFQEFLDTIHKKGLGVAEMLAMEMKTSGMYVSRGLSFQEAEFVNVEICLDESQKKMYNTAAHLWGELRRSLDVAVERTSCSNNRVWSNFWAAHQRFFKQLCLGMKVPAIVTEAKTVLDSGHCVVIGLQTTGEASMDSELNKCKMAPLVGFVSLCREILTRFIEQSFPVTNENQNVAHPIDDWCCTAKQMLLSFANRIELPNSPLDDIIDRLGGPGCVAEMTGRRGRMVRRSPQSQPQYELRDKDLPGGLDSINVTERNLFMQGSKFVAIISDAASTGISLHADLRVGNQRRRVHLTLELPWSADKAVQQLGRSHRSNQSSGPLYKLITTDLGGERRFASAVARRLQSLGALTKGDRRAASGADLTEFNFDTPYGRTALRTMYSAICRNVIVPGVALATVAAAGQDFAAFNAELHDCLASMGVLESATLTDLPKVKDKESSDVGKFLNRILGLSVEHQNLIFNYFTKSLSAQVASAKKEGKYSEGLVDITASSINIVGKPREVFNANMSSSNPTRHFVLNIDRGMSWQRALQRLSNYDTSEESPNGFYCSRREHKGRRWFILATQKHTSSHLFTIARPNTGVSGFEEEKTDLLHKYMPISREKAETGWTEQYNSTRERCIHGPQCRSGSSCTVGARCYGMHLLCGGIVTMLSLLETTLARYGPQLQLTKAESTLRVVRVQLENGERLVGVRYPHTLLHLVEKAINDRRMMELAQRQQRQLLLMQQQLMSTSATPQSNTSTTTSHVTSVQCSDSSDASHVTSIHANDSAGASHVTSVSIIEQVTPVNKKCFLKAITPPVTIKNFFKPAKTPPSDSNDGSCCSSTDNEAQVHCNGGTRPSDGSNTRLKTSISMKRPRPPNTGKQPTSKRVKQSSIASLFARGKRPEDTESTTQRRQCPVCGETFQTSLSNAQINEHIDTCLID